MRSPRRRQARFTWEFGVLATYNGEKARGLVHTPEWKEAMSELQVRFDDSNDGLLLVNNPNAVPYYGQ